MLSYALAIAVALSSFVLFLTAFLMSDIHRQDDFLWSGVGLFYALVLWFCARNITGAVLLGQASVSILLISFIWQTLKLRKAIAHPEQAQAINDFSILKVTNKLFTNKKNQASKGSSSAASSNKKAADVVTESEISIPQSANQAAQSSTSDNAVSSQANQKSKPNLLKKIFNKPQKSSVANTNVGELFDSAAEKTAVVAEDTTKPKAVTSNLPTDTENTDLSSAAQFASDEPEKISQESSATTLNDASEPVKPEIPQDTPSAATDSSDSPVKENEATEVVEQTETEIAVEIKTEITAATSEAEVIEETADSVVDNQQNDSAAETEIEEKVQSQSTSEDTPSAIAEVTEVTTEHQTTKSALDGLETVEVAEVLEAIPDNLANKKNDNSINIIEVKTTEIDELKESDPPDTDLKSQDES